MAWKPISPCSACRGTGSILGIGGRKTPCEACEASGGGPTWIRARRGLLVILSRAANGSWRGRLALGEGARLREGVAGIERRIKPSRTTLILPAMTWETLREAKAGADLAAQLLVTAATRRADVEGRAS